MNFDTLAPHYRWMEWVLAGGKLQRCRTAFLPAVTDARKILILGEGNGRFLAECRRAMPEAHITCIDDSKRMLHFARRRLERVGLGTAGMEFIHADALEWHPPDCGFDLVVTHFFLDCFGPAQLECLVKVIAGSAAAQATWLLADFAVPARGPGRYRALAIHRMMYTFFRIATRLPARALTPPDQFLRAHGFKLAERRLGEWGLLQTDRWARGTGQGTVEAPARRETSKAPEDVRHVPTGAATTQFGDAG